MESERGFVVAFQWHTQYSVDLWYYFLSEDFFVKIFIFKKDLADTIEVNCKKYVRISVGLKWSIILCKGCTL